jgi:hypothetical protein
MVGVHVPVRFAEACERKRESLCADTCVGAEAWELVCGSVRACGPAVFGWPFRGGGSELNVLPWKSP